jgi:hypothetical protein
LDKTTRATLDNLYSDDRQVQNKSFLFILAATDKRVDWAYDVWDETVVRLRDKDNHARAIAAQVLCNLAKSDPQNRILKNLPALLALTKDERFVTARHCMQSLWKVGVVGEKHREKLVKGLAVRFAECVKEKNCTLIRYDILTSLRNVYAAVKDEKIRKKALELIETEKEAKYRKKYAALWRV